MDVINISRLKDEQTYRDLLAENINSAGIGGFINPCACNEIPDGTILVFTFKHPDGVTAVTNAAPYSEKVWVDATQQFRGTDYTFDAPNGTVTFEAGHAPIGGTVVTMECTMMPVGI